MRDIAQKIIDKALKAVDPYQAVINHLKRNDDTLVCGSHTYDLANFDRVRIIGFGKGSTPMAQAAHDLLADKITDGLVIVKYGHILADNINISPVALVEAGHPVPDEKSLAHSTTLVSMLADGTESDLVLCLISGGGSALLTRPVDGISLADVQTLTKALLAAGATINEINAIRKHLSSVKGGQLARLAHPATLISLILSDVGGDPLDVIASGPTTPDFSTFEEALRLLEKYHLTKQVAPSIPAHLQAGRSGSKPETPKQDDPAFKRVQNHIIANNQMALEAAVEAARELGWHADSFGPFLEGEATEVARQIAFLARTVSLNSTIFKKPAALIFGGETTVTLKGNGLGGRNQQLALATALHIQNSANLLVAYIATDGNDGPTDAAGAIVDGQTISKATTAGLDPLAYLDNNDSYHFFRAIDDLIITGPTNTNVNDIVLILAW